jgi:hypothetical protein
VKPDSAQANFAPVEGLPAQNDPEIAMVGLAADSPILGGDAMLAYNALDLHSVALSRAGPGRFACGYREFDLGRWAPHGLGETVTATLPRRRPRESGRQKPDCNSASAPGRAPVERCGETGTRLVGRRYAATRS